MGRVLAFTQVDELVGVLNASNITSTTEVVVAPPSVYLHGVSQKLRGDVKVRKAFSPGVLVVVFARSVHSQISRVCSRTTGAVFAGGYPEYCCACTTAVSVFKLSVEVPMVP